MIKPEAVALAVVFPLKAFLSSLSPAIWGVNDFSELLTSKSWAPAHISR